MKNLLTVLFCSFILHFAYGGAPINHTFSSSNLNVSVGEQVFFMSTITPDQCGTPTLLWDFGPNADPPSLNMTFAMNTFVAFNLPAVVFNVPGFYNVTQTLISGCSPPSPIPLSLIVAVSPAINIPTLSQWGLMVLGMLIMIFGATSLKKSYKSSKKAYL